MKTRLFTASAFLASMALLALLVPGWALPAAAQSQPVAPGLPILSTGEGQAEGSAPGADRSRGTEGLRSSPVMFIENVGQFADGARFQVRGGDHTMWLADDAIWVTVMEQPQVDPEERFDRLHTKLEREDEQLRGVNLKLSFVGANPNPGIEPFDRLDTHVSYFIGNDPDQWHPDVPVWGGVRYKELYPGVDLEVAGEEDRWVWRLITNDASALEDVRLQVEGADDLDLEDDLLHLTAAVGEHTLPLLLAVDSQGQPVRMPSGPSLTGHEVALPFRSSVSYLPAGIAGADDLRYATFLGGGDHDVGWGIAVDGSGMAYVTGYTYSPNFPTTYGAYDRSHNGGRDVFVVKLNTTGSSLVYATFLGGGAHDYGWGIAVDGSAMAYVTGYTVSSNFPTTYGAYDRSHDGWSDVFVVKLNTTGSSLVYATFLGGGDYDWSLGIAVDGSGIAYVTGSTESSNFPTTYGAYDRSHNGERDVFVVKLNTTGSSLVYATFLGGGAHDYGQGIAVDGSGIACVTGDTYSSNFPTTYGAYDRRHDGWRDAFVVKLNTTGSSLVYATFLGGLDNDYGLRIAVDGSGMAYVTGGTYSSNFPTTYGAYDRSYNGSRDAFVAKLNATGSDLVYSTFLGGVDYDYGYGIAVDSGRMVYVTGGTSSSNFPTTPEAYDRSYNGNYDAFVAKLGLGGDNAPNGLDVSQLERGDILLVNAAGWLVPVVGTFGGYWGHTGMYAGDGQVVESIVDGVTQRPIEQTTFWTSRDWVVKRVNTTAHWKDYATSFAEDQAAADKPYNWEFWDKWRTDKYYCSQLVWRGYWEAGTDIDSDWSIESCLKTHNTVICDLLNASVPPDDIYYDDDVTEVQAKVWDAKRAVLYLASPADLYITDPYGRHVGVDPITGVVVEEIPEVVYYSGPDAEPEHVVIMDMEGSWDVKVIGRGSGSYTLVTEVVGLGEKHQVDYVTETTSPWQIDDYTLVYPTTPGDPIRVTEHPVYIPLILRRR